MVHSISIVIWRITVFLALVLYMVLNVGSAYAQAISSYGIATPLSIKNKVVRDGDIVSSVDGGYSLSRESYDPRVFGIVAINPAIEFSTANQEANSYPVVSAGDTLVNVSTINGPIKKGDAITTSPIPGVGMKATESGYAIGYAQENFSTEDAREIKQVKISINKQFFAPLNSSSSSRLMDIFRLSAIATYERPLTVLRYLVAAIVVITAFMLGFLSFGRTASIGIEALGRNPLAARMIQFGIIINVLITVVIIGTGLGIAFLILKV